MKKRKQGQKAAQAGTSRRGCKETAEFPGVKSYKDRHGKTRWRIRDADNNTVNLGTDYGSPEFIRRYTQAMGLQADQDAARVFQAPVSADGTHSLSTLIDNWYGSAQFRGLGPTTAYTYTKIAERLRTALGDAPVETLSRAVVKQIMQSCADRPGAANNFLRILRLMLDHAMETLEWIDHNPAKEVRKFSSQRPGGFHTWSEQEIARFYARWEFGTTADLVMSVMLYTGASRADAVRLGPANLSRSENGEPRLSYRRQKMMTRGGAVVDIPVHPELARRLEGLPDGQNTFL